MNRIVVANDFSTCSENAVKYAQLLGGRSKQFLHPFFNSNTYQNTADLEVVIKEISKLEEFNLEVSQPVTYNHLLVLGQELLKKLKKNTTYEIKKPFLVVPSTHTFKKVNKVLFLCFSSKIDELLTKIDLNRFSNLFEGEAHIMNIYKEEETEEEKLLQFVLDYQSDNKNGSFLFFNDVFLLEHIHQYIKKTGTNLAVLLSSPEDSPKMKGMNIERILENINIPFLTSFVSD